MGVSFSFLGLVSGNSLSPSTPDCEVGQGRAFEPVMVMDRPFFRVRQRRGRQHGADRVHDPVRCGRSNPCPVQIAGIIRRKADGIIGRHIAPGASAPNAVTPITCGKEGTSGQKKEKTVMKYFAGIDVSLNESSVCVVDETGVIIGEARGALPRCNDAIRKRS